MDFRKILYSKFNFPVSLLIPVFLIKISNGFLIISETRQTFETQATPRSQFFGKFGFSKSTKIFTNFFKNPVKSSRTSPKTPQNLQEHLQESSRTRRILGFQLPLDCQPIDRIHVGIELCTGIEQCQRSNQFSLTKPIPCFEQKLTNIKFKIKILKVKLINNLCLIV